MWPNYEGIIEVSEPYLRFKFIQIHRSSFERSHIDVTQERRQRRAHCHAKFVVFTHVDNSSVMASTLNDVLSSNVVCLYSLFLTIAGAASVGTLVNRLMTSKLTSLSCSSTVISLIRLMKCFVSVMADCVFPDSGAIISNRNLASR
ncbi:hypothetical protein Trydic_g6406 [Trypoxylus dichotomus]